MRWLRSIFVGPSGWRAGWRFLVFFTTTLVAAKGLFWLLGLAGYHEAAAGWSASGLLVEASLTTVAVLVAMSVMARLERRRFGHYGLPLERRSAALFGHGLLWGFLASTAVLLAIAASGGATFHGFALGGAEAVRPLLLWAATMLLLGLAEELLYRGYPLATFTDGMGFWPAAVLSSLLFGAAHLAKPNETAMDIASIVLFGLLWCFTIRRTGSIWFAAGFHAMYDYANLVLYAAPNTGNGGRAVPGHLLDIAYSGPAWLSGGPCGMEASLYSFVAIGAMWLLFARWFRAVLLLSR
jgi:membrane protease YdiL (CAAX protease family)